jgi:hypothetical protein
MIVDVIAWDDEDDPGGNVRHVAAAGLTPADVDHAILNRPGGRLRPDAYSRDTGLPIIFGDTPGGDRIAVVYEDESDSGFVVIRPKTAYHVNRKGD